jgi:hypothetical protein
MHDDVALDTDAMRVAVLALSRIPTAHRRTIALDWLVARVEADIVRLRDAEDDACRVDRATRLALGADGGSSSGRQPDAPGSAPEGLS